MLQEHPRLNFDKIGVLKILGRFHIHKLWDSWPAT